MREAVQQLVQERYLVTAPHMGITVSIISDEDVCKTFEIRAALESLAARLSPGASRKRTSASSTG